MAYDQLPDRETIDGVLAALRGNGITAYFAEDGAAAKEMAVDLMPEGAQVMNMTSRTVTGPSATAMPPWTPGPRSWT
jgi:hypothetical protein